MGLFSFLGNVGAGIQGARLGKKQMKLGKGMLEEGQALSAAYERPEMMTPQAIQMMMEMSKGGQFEEMPGMTTMQNQIAKATAGGVSAMKEMGTGAEAFGGVADLYASQMETEAGLGIEGARFKEGRREDYMADLEGLGQWEQQAWNWNEADPYLQAQQKAAQLEQAGRSGQWEGLKTKMGSWAESFKGMGGALDETAGQLASAFTGGTFGNVMGAISGKAA
jgi:hypothetical protein